MTTDNDNRIVIAIALCAIIMAIVLVFAFAGPTKAQQRTIYDNKTGRAVGTIIENRNTRTLYGADGRVITREATDTQGTTTIYDRAGNKVGTTTGKRP